MGDFVITFLSLALVACGSGTEITTGGTSVDTTGGTDVTVPDGGASDAAGDPDVPVTPPDAVVVDKDVPDDEEVVEVGGHGRWGERLVGTPGTAV